MPNIGKGVEEIRIRDENGAYRIIYTGTARRDNRLYRSAGIARTCCGAFFFGRGSLVIRATIIIWWSGSFTALPRAFGN